MSTTGSNEIGFPSPPVLVFPTPADEREYIKHRLAGAYRIFAQHHLNEGLAGHITARDPIDPNTFWVNPFGVDFSRIVASDLLRVDHAGNVLDHGRVPLLNRAAFLLHAAIHAARPDVMCAAHTHSLSGRAFCALGKRLDPISIESSVFFEDHVVFDGKGLVIGQEEGAAAARALGGNKAALLRNHGLLTVGGTIEEAVHWYYLLDRSCQVQLMADAAAAGTGGQTFKFSDDEARYNRAKAGSPKAGWFGGQMMFDVIDELTGKTYMQ